MLALASLLLFAAVLLAVLGLAEPVRALAGSAREEEPGPHALGESPLRTLARILAPLNAGPRMATRVASLDRKWVEAGRPGGRLAGSEFLSGVEWLALAATLTMLGLFAIAGGLGPFTVVFSLAVGAFAGWIPFLWLDARIADRRTAIASQLPYFLDLAVMTMEAGATFAETMQIYRRDNPDDALAEEIGIALGEIRMGKTADEALEGMISRVHVEDLTYTVNAILQGQRMGTPLGQVLRDQADVMRFRRSQRAERMAEELKVRIQGPTMLMMISVFLLILGPAFLKVLTSGIF